MGEEFTLNQILSPASFLIGTHSLGQPNFAPQDDSDPDYVIPSTTEQLVTLWKRQQKCLDAFWKTWSTEYFHSLRTSSHANQNFEEPRVGTVVLIRDENVSRSCWKIGLVTSLQRSRDKIVRTATVRLASGKTMKRSVSHLYPLEVSESIAHSAPSPECMETDTEPAQAPKRPRRNAAAAAELRNSDLIEEGHI